MSMLTFLDDQGNWGLRNLKWQQLWAGQVITDEVYGALYGALHKLMEYEQTGLQADEVQELKEATEWRKPQWELPPDDSFVLAVVSGRSKDTTFHKACVMAAYYRDESEWDIDVWPDFVGTIEAWKPLPEVR